MITLPPDWEMYIERHSVRLPPILDEIERDTYLKTTYPQMLSGKIQAAFLHFMVKMIRPARILELGTFTGYATVAMASAMPPHAVIDTVEIDGRTAEMAATYFARTPWHDRIRLHRTAAEEFLKNRLPAYDFIFLDADKENYPLYFHLLKPLLSPRGLWITDNTLWNGKVLSPTDPASIAIHRFNEAATHDPQLLPLLLPLRDGLMCVMKLPEENSRD